jgi:very-short-patch-repair endonuclease/predicted transcriptional regulator of viral defense system
MGDFGAEPRAETEESHRLACSVDQAAAMLAAEQDGIVSRRQLVAIGMDDDAIGVRVCSGRLYRVRRGVYAVGHPGETIRSRLRQALATVGEGSAVSHLSAAAELGLRPPHPPVIDITCPRALRSRPGIRLHRCRLDPDEVRFSAGIPVTSPSRTLFDLAAMVGFRTLERAANQAFVLRLVAIEELTAAGERHRRRKGSTAFARLLGVLDPDGRMIRSPLEGRLNAFLHARRFPPWETNQRLRIGADLIEPDVLWRDRRVIVEADGRDPHLAPLTFTADRRRDRRLSARGWRPVRITTSDLEARPDELEADLRAILESAPRQ